MSNAAFFRFIWPFIWAHRYAFAFMILCSLGWALDATLWPYIFRVVIDIFTQYDSDRAFAWSALQLPVFLGLGLWALIELGFRLMGYLLAYTIPKVEAEIRLKMFDHVQRHSPKYFNEQLAGSLSNKITDMTTQAGITIQQSATVFVPGLMACILGLFFFANISPVFAVILGVWIVVQLILGIIFTPKCDQLEHLHGEERTHLLGKIVDSLTNNFAVNLFYRFPHEYALTALSQARELRKNITAKRYVEFVRVLFGMSTILGAGVAILGLMIYYWIEGTISTGEVVQLFNTTMNLIMIIWTINTTIPALFQALGMCKQALVVMHHPQDIVDPIGAKPLLVTKGEIVFDGVSFHYGERQLFQNKHVHINGGEKLGLVGYSGAGKSTFISLILRFYPLETGTIRIDGQDISLATLESLRHQIALIPQDTILFHRSLWDNIHYGKLHANREQVIEAARMAHCEEFISRLPQGYDTLVGERGTKLSGGERQRIAIARAILADAPILILDEATSALDSMTEKYIQESLELLMKNRTTIVVAHRLSTLAKMDRILVFDQGKIVEEGTHQTLLQAGSHYARMWQRQAGGFLPDSVS